jgi:hypothetical protein
MSGTSMAICAGDRWVLWWVPASASALLVTRDWLVGSAADLGKGAAITHELVRESGGVSASKSFPTMLAFITACCWCSSRRDCARGIAGPEISLSTAGIRQRRISPKRTPSEPRAGIVCTADPLILAGGLSGPGGELSARRTGMWR